MSLFYRKHKLLLENMKIALEREKAYSAVLMAIIEDLNAKVAMLLERTHSRVKTSDGRTHTEN